MRLAQSRLYPERAVVLVCVNDLPPGFMGASVVEALIVFEFAVNLGGPEHPFIPAHCLLLLRAFGIAHNRWTLSAPRFLKT